MKNLSAHYDPSRKTILALNHFWEQDLRALDLANQEFNFIKIDGPALFKGAKLYFKDVVRRLDAPYSSEDEASLSAWRQECSYILDLLDRRFGANLILLPSDVYFWVREFIIEARSRGIKIIIVDKEGTKTDYALRMEAVRIRNNAPSLADHVYVWSARTQEYWRQVGVDEKLISVIGQPRSDLFYIDKQHELDKYFSEHLPLIVFFSYHDDAYIPPQKIVNEGLSWRSMKKETHDEILRLAQKYRNFNFVVKTHPQQSDLEDLQNRYHLDNLRVLGGSSISNELIQRGELVIGFQTTALIEAMFMNRRIVYTCWDKNVSRLSDDLLPIHQAPGILVAESFVLFSAACERFLSGDHSDFLFSEDDIRGRNQFVNEYFYMPDGRVCDRFYKSVRRFIR